MAGISSCCAICSIAVQSRRRSPPVVRRHCRHLWRQHNQGWQMHCRCVSTLEAAPGGVTAAINQRFARDATALQAADSGGRVEAIQLLLDLGADHSMRNDKGLMALHLSALGGHN